MFFADTVRLWHAWKRPGHKNIESTFIHITIEEATFGLSEGDEFRVRGALTLHEFIRLLERGFSYVPDHNGMKILRKLK